MDIHKPKPIHSFREFVSEIAVVVVGIAIALTGEQIVERIHEHQIAAEAREQIRSEVATDLAVLGNRVKIEACIDKRLTQLRRLLATAGPPAYVTPTWIGRPDGRRLARAAGSLCSNRASNWGSVSSMASLPRFFW